MACLKILYITISCCTKTTHSFSVRLQQFMTIFPQFQCHTKSLFKHQFEQGFQRAPNLHTVEGAQRVLEKMGNNKLGENHRHLLSTGTGWGPGPQCFGLIFKQKTGHSLGKCTNSAHLKGIKIPKDKDTELKDTWLWQTELTHPALSRLSAKPEESNASAAIPLAQSSLPSFTQKRPKPNCKVIARGEYKIRSGHPCNLRARNEVV